MIPYKTHTVILRESASQTFCQNQFGLPYISFLIIMLKLCLSIHSKKSFQILSYKKQILVKRLQVGENYVWFTYTIYTYE